jgi:hypothetical protein
MSGQKRRNNEGERFTCVRFMMHVTPRCRFFSAVAALILLIQCAGVRDAAAALTPADDTSLTTAFESLSRGWVQPAVDLSNTILTRPEYTAADWTAWFDKYFNATRHPLTDDLWNYLGYPVFGWFDDTAHLKLQMALIDPLWTKAVGIVAQNHGQLGQAFYCDPDLRQSVFNSHRFFARIASNGIIPDAKRQDVYHRYKTHITGYPQYFSNATTIDSVTQPLVALLRAQVWASFCDTLPLTPALKTEIAQTIALDRAAGKKLSIWNKCGVLIMDNNRLDDTQLATNDVLLGAIPAGLSNLRFVTVREFLQYPCGGIPIVLKGQTGGAVNYYFWVAEGRATLSFDGAPGSWTGPSGSRPIRWDTWNHVAGTYDGTTMRVFLNGEETASLATSGTPVTISREPLRIGQMPDFKAWMRGSLDEVKIFNRALSAAEIQQDQQLRPVSSEGLLCYCKMDETKGTTVADSSGHRHHGTPAGPVPTLGRANNGLFFDGQNDSVVVEDRPDLRLNGSMTITAWIKVADEWPFLQPGTSGMVNTFGCKVDQPTENSFPSDIEPRTVSTFCAGNMHEFNHVVDAFTVWRNPALKARETQLIAQAGKQPLQYLRSMCVKGDGTSVFPDGPQEFFASMSNEYFTDSWHTLDLALARFTRGYKEPLNQFLFFASVYAQGEASTKVYTLDAVGRLTVADAAIRRDTQGRIIQLTRGALIYRFTLDAAGNVTAWSGS